MEKTQIRLGKSLAVDDRAKTLLELKSAVQHLEEMYQTQSVTLMVHLFVHSLLKADNPSSI